MFYGLPVEVQEVENGVCILLFARCEHADLIHRRQVLQDFLEVLPHLHVEQHLRSFRLPQNDVILEYAVHQLQTALVFGQVLIWLQGVELAVNQRFVHIQDQCFELSRRPKVNHFRLQLVVAGQLQHRTGVQQIAHVFVNKIVHIGLFLLFLGGKLSFPLLG